MIGKGVAAARAEKPSRSADYVAVLRGLGPMLPPDCRLIEDPWGAEWTGFGPLRQFSEHFPRLARALGRPIYKDLLYLQVRSRALDDHILRFAQSGGRQLIILGAGLDGRSLRLRELSLTTFEIDRPATQARKRRLAGDCARYLPWDFESGDAEAFAALLAGLGHRLGERSCVICEGVTMYLTENANARLFAALRDNLACGSTVAFTYFRSRLEMRNVRARLTRLLVGFARERWGFGWSPENLPAWLSRRGFRLVTDDTSAVLAARLLPAYAARLLARRSSQLAVAELCPPTL